MKGKRITALVMAALFMLSVLAAGPAAAVGKKYEPIKKDPKVCLKVIKVVKFDKKKTLKKAHFFWIKQSKAWKFKHLKFWKFDDHKFLVFKVVKVDNKKDCFAKNKHKKFIPFGKWWWHFVKVVDWDKVDQKHLFKFLFKLDFDELDTGKLIKFLLFKLDLELDTIVAVLLDLERPLADIIDELQDFFDLEDIVGVIAAEVDLDDLAEALADLEITVDCDLLDIIVEASGVAEADVRTALADAEVEVECVEE